MNIRCGAWRVEPASMEVCMLWKRRTSLSMTLENGRSQFAAIYLISHVRIYTSTICKFQHCTLQKAVSFSSCSSLFLNGASVLSIALQKTCHSKCTNWNALRSISICRSTSLGPKATLARLRNSLIHVIIHLGSSVFVKRFLNCGHRTIINYYVDIVQPSNLSSRFNKRILASLKSS